MPRDSTWSAARRMRSSFPSGRTTWASVARARATRSCSNINGVTAPAAPTSSPPRSASRSGSSAASSRVAAARSLRADAVVIRPSTRPSAVATAMVPSGAAMIGSRTSRPAMRRSTCGERRKPPLSTTPESVGSVRAWWARSTPRTTSSRSPGTMTTAPSKSRSMTCGIDMAATRRPRLSRSSRSASPWTRMPSHAVTRSATVGARSRAVSGRGHTGTAPNRSRRADRRASRPSPGTWLTTTPATWAWPSRAATTAADALDASSRASRSRAGTTRTIGVPRSAAIRALVPNSVGAATSVKSDPTTSTASCPAATAWYRSTTVSRAAAGSAWRASCVTPQPRSGRRSVGACWSSTRSSSSVAPSRTMGRKTPTRACRRASRATSPTATADFPDRASVPAR